MTVRVEFYGIPRARAGVAETVVETVGGDVRLGDVLAQLAKQYPQLAEACINHDRLRLGCMVNIDGRRFVTDPETCVSAGQTLLLMSADTGG